MNDSEYAARWRILAAQLSKLERDAGIGDAAGQARKAMPSSPSVTRESDVDGAAGESPELPDPVPRDVAQRRDLRALYFSVSHPALRRSLIAKQRELELFERTVVRTRLEEARRDHELVKRRPSEGWWIAAIVGATLVIIGYWLFAIAGAIAAGVVALFVGNGIEQAARRRFEHAVAFAEEDVGAAEAAAVNAEQSRDLFSERESATGQSDRASEVGDDLSARTH